jgi:hypothetical protein
VTETPEACIIAEDIEVAGFCPPGVRTWLRLNGASELLPLLFSTGVPVSRIRPFNCPLGNKMCDVAEARVAKELRDGK